VARAAVAATVPVTPAAARVTVRPGPGGHWHALVTRRLRLRRTVTAVMLGAAPGLGRRGPLSLRTRTEYSDVYSKFDSEGRQ
jgi:hypothetical protein